MTIPGREEPRAGLTPARRGRDRGRQVTADETAPPTDDADLQRGLAAAVLSAMGRTQLKLDAMSRQQADQMAALQARLAALDSRMAALEATLRYRPTLEAAPASVPRSEPDPLWGEVPGASHPGSA